MSIDTALLARGENKCEFCSAEDGLSAFEVSGASEGGVDESVLTCAICKGQLEKTVAIDMHHWRCLNESMWSQVPAVQVVAWRMLKTLNSESWAQDLLDMLYLEEDVLAWAEAGMTGEQEENTVIHMDSNGAVLQAGDTVVLIKDLNVKGAGFTAKRGTAVRGISLVPDNAEHIEGRVSGQQIVILTKFVKKSG